MTRSQILLSLVLNEVNIPASIEAFDNRLLVQKTIYLVQQAGVQLGYPYNWYLRGPYSSPLANDLFAIAEQEENEIEPYALGEKTRSLISKIKRLFDCSNIGELAKHLELLASVLFLINTRQVKSNDSEGISLILKANSKPFDSSDCKQAVVLLRECGYAV